MSVPRDLVQLDQPQQKHTHTITLDSDFDSSIKRFTIRDANGNALWTGVTFGRPHEELASEFDLALQEAWLMGQLETKEMLETRAIKVSLKIDADWVLYRKRENYTINERSVTTVMLWRNDEKERLPATDASAATATLDGARSGQESPPPVAGRARAA